MRCYAHPTALGIGIDKKPHVGQSKISKPELPELPKLPDETYSTILKPDIKKDSLPD